MIVAHDGTSLVAGSASTFMLSADFKLPTRYSSLDARTMLGAAAVLVPLMVLYQLILRPYIFSSLRKLPGPRGSLWSPWYLFMGEFPTIISREAGTVQREWAKLYGTVVRAVGPFGIERVIFLSPPAMQKVLVDDWIDYPRPRFMRNILGLTAGYGLLTVSGDEHRTMRRTINPAFSIQSLKAQTDMFYGPIYSLVEILESQSKVSTLPGEGKCAVFHMYDWLSKATLDIICLAAFGYEVDSLHKPSSELADAYHELLDLQNGHNLGRIILIVLVPGAPALLRSEWLYRHRHWLRKIAFLQPIEVVVNSMHRINDRGQHMGGQKKDIMSLLVQARMQTQTKTSSDGGDGGAKMAMTDSMMMEQVLTFLGAGHETTASGLAWTLWLLASHPEVQEKLRREVSPVTSLNPNPDFRTLKSFEYLEHVVMESLRLYPPVPMTMRKATKSDYIDGTYVPKGTLFYIAIRVINTYQAFWGHDAEDFRPDRWSELSKAPAYHPMHSFQTFIYGPHHCIGKTLAMVEMKAVLAVLISKFKFSPAYAGQRAQPTAAVTMKPADNLPLRVEPVDNYN